MQPIKKNNKMKNILTVCFTIVILTIIAACNNHSNDDQNIDNIDLNVKDLDSLELNRVFSLNRYIPLETNIESAITMIDKIIIHDSIIYVLDRFHSKKLAAFDMKGKFLFQVSKQGRGPGEYGYIFDFTIKNNIIYLLDDRSHFRKFELNGKYLNSEKLPFWTDRLVPSNTENFGMLTNADLSINAKNNFNILSKDCKRFEGEIQTRFIGIPSYTTQQVTTIRDTSYFFLPYEPYIYQFAEDKLLTKYKINYPPDCILSDDRIDFVRNRRGEEMIKMTKETICIDNIIFTDELEMIIYEQKQIPYYLFKLQSETIVVQQKNIVNNVDRLPILPRLINNFESNKIIGVYYPYTLLETSNQKAFNTYPISSYYTTENENPILVIYNVKK